MAHDAEEKKELESENESSIFHMSFDEIKSRFREVVVLFCDCPSSHFWHTNQTLIIFGLVNCGVCSTHTHTRALKINSMKLTQSTMGVKFENHRIISNTESNIWAISWWSIVEHPHVLRVCVWVFAMLKHFLAFFVCIQPTFACARKRKQYHCLKFNWWKQEYLKTTYNIFASCLRCHTLSPQNFPEFTFIQLVKLVK